MMDSWEENCHRIVVAELARRGWQLADNRELADTISRELASSQPTVDAIRRATTHQYSQILYFACSGSDLGRQQLAFQELWTYLHAIALARTNDADLAEDITQQALFKTWENLSRCREPGRFLSYTSLILMNLIQDYYRRMYRREEKLAEPIWARIETTETEILHAVSEMKTYESDSEEEDPESSSWESERADNTTASEFEGVPMDDASSTMCILAHESRNEWLTIIKDSVKNEKLKEVLIGLFFDDKSYQELADELGISVGNVYVLSHRALKALRTNERFIHFIEERSR